MSIKPKLRAAAEQVWRQLYHDRPATFWGAVTALIVVYVIIRIGAVIAATNDTMFFLPF
jgi:hypothetical protein